MRRLSLALVLLISGGVCSISCGAGPVTASEAALGQEFKLAPGETAHVGGDGFGVTFERVLEDSRCPSGAFCVTAGEVLIEVDAAGQRCRLRPQEAATSGPYRVRLLRVEPYPASAAPIEPSQYRATLVVDRP